MGVWKPRICPHCKTGLVEENTYCKTCGSELVLEHELALWKDEGTRLQSDPVPLEKHIRITRCPHCHALSHNGKACSSCAVTLRSTGVYAVSANHIGQAEREYHGW